MASKRESDEDYVGVVARLGPKHRVIKCKDDIQWILQEKGGKTWRNQKYFRSREGLIRRVSGLPGANALASILPEWYPGSQHGLGAGTEPPDAA